MEFIRWIIGFIFAAILAGFAVLNIHPTQLIWSPIHEPLELPLYMITLPIMALGFICGGFLVWLNSSPVRRIKRKQSKKIKTLEKEIAHFNKEEKNQSPPSDFFPTLPNKNQKRIKSDNKNL